MCDSACNFNLFLAAVMAAVRSDISPADSVSLSYRLDGSLFNLRRLKAQTKVSVDHVIELQYADDAAVLRGTPDGLQRSLNLINDWYSRAGLIINTTETESMSNHARGDDPLYLR